MRELMRETRFGVWGGRWMRERFVSAGAGDGFVMFDFGGSYSTRGRPHTSPLSILYIG